MPSLRYAVLGAAAAWAVYEDVRLVRAYPLHAISKATDAAWPECVRLDKGAEVRARVRIPRGQNERDAFVRAFYETWTLRVEGAFARTFNIQSTLPAPPPHVPGTPSPTPSGSRPTTPFAKTDSTATLEAAANGTPLPLPRGRDPAVPNAFANGLFPVLGHTPDSVMVWWSGPKGAGGAQLLTARRVGDSDLVDISFACAETPTMSSGLTAPVLTIVHHTYMRFLLDRAAARLERRAMD